MGRPISPIGEARLQKEQALAKLRTLQSDALEGRLLDREQVRAQWAQAFAALRDRALGIQPWRGPQCRRIGVRCRCRGTRSAQGGKRGEF
jgi:hypothetical protein